MEKQKKMLKTIMRQTAAVGYKSQGTRCEFAGGDEVGGEFACALERVL